MLTPDALADSPFKRDDSPELVSTSPFTLDKDDAFWFFFTSTPNALMTTPSSSTESSFSFTLTDVELADFLGFHPNVAKN